MAARAAFRVFLRLRFVACPEMMTLATSRFRSHSHGAQADSSKSFRSKTRVRWGDA